MFKNQFIVLFGSVARGDDNINSDLDILLINIDIYESENILRQYKLPNYPHNYIEYNYDTFYKFHIEGSLFLHHIFLEGKVIYGNMQLWNKLKREFRVKSSFIDEIKKIQSDISLYRNLDFSNGFYLSVLDNIYPLLKNYCIFKLANKGIYIFNKKECIIEAVKNEQLRKKLLELQQFYDYSTRNISLNLTIKPNSLEAKKLILTVYFLIKKDLV
ncbi:MULTISPECIES: nucleotidyltransferase domain-containing protein [Pasteurella]|nr:MULTISPECIES: nucleotidyltransferase domain-containing protein [Pasteurella]AMM82936.1 hypothetical protein AW43_00380 [Pasteurella multocida subsp. multocida PMTB2.1]APW57659.1 hypothetical protein BV212_05515 [Pasteurella multocida]AXQ72507.1 hypothetical protein AWY89_05815 [Pasteurella multocida subsp. multocida]MCH4803765.1 nucleotidyltransferase domain-containing protein [Pasteurella multocida]MCL7849986.1 nucleotidyltransferase domain-containing protein [Pasteurella multocida]